MHACIDAIHACMPTKRRWARREKSEVEQCIVEREGSLETLNDSFTSSLG
jgi:hypothetical protein